MTAGVDDDYRQQKRSWFIEGGTCLVGSDEGERGKGKKQGRKRGREVYITRRKK